MKRIVLCNDPANLHSMVPFLHDPYETDCLCFFKHTIPGDFSQENTIVVLEKHRFALYNRNSVKKRPGCKMCRKRRHEKGATGNGIY